MLLLITTALFLQTPSLRAEGKTTFTAASLAEDCAALDRDLSSQPSDQLTSYRAGYCTGYLTGILGAYNAYPLVKPRLCLPAGVNVGQMEKIFMKYINEHPEQLHLEA